MTADQPLEQAKAFARKARDQGRLPSAHGNLPAVRLAAKNQSRFFGEPRYQTACGPSRSSIKATPRALRLIARSIEHTYRSTKCN
jgi:hypothetical protein